MITLNLFLAVILEAFAETSCFENYKLRTDDLIKFIKAWEVFDTNGDGFIATS